MCKKDYHDRWVQDHPDLHRRYMMKSYIRAWRKYAAEHPDEAEKIINELDQIAVDR